jgi:hypothetical protein
VAETDSARKSFGWIAPVFYSLSVSFCAGLLSFLVLLVVVQLTDDGERAMWYGVAWVFMLPWILMAGILGRVTFGWYRAQPAWGGAAVVFVTTVMAATLVGVAVGYGFAWINS